MEATQVEKIVRLDKGEVIKYQIMHHCFMKKLRVNETELSCLAFLGECGKLRLSDFCKLAAERGFFSHRMAVANCLSRLEDRGLCVKEGVGKKVICLNPELQIQSEGDIIISIKLVKRESKADKRNLQTNGAATELAGAVH